MINYKLDTFEEVVEYVAELVGQDFIRVVAIANKIIDTPTDYTGPQASIAAIKLASYRTKIGVVAQFYKLKSADTKKPLDRLTKDALMVMYDATLELINTLKLNARHEHEQVR